MKSKRDTKLLSEIAKRGGIVKVKEKKVLPCPWCGTPCTIEGIGDFNSKDIAVTLHYEPAK